MWEKYKIDFLYGALIFIITIFFSFDLFIHQGQPATFDGPTHIANIAQVHYGLKDGEFPVRWGDGFARYGMPIPQIAQQTTSYLGAVLNFLVQDVALSYNLVIMIGLFVTTVLMYLFLRLYVAPFPAFVGAFVFHFAPYRIMNVYIRGALPEFFASIFIISILISLYLAIEKSKFIGYILLIISISLLLLTHPFTFIIGSFVFIPYGIFLLWKKNKKIGKLVVLGFCSALGFGLAAYYLVPLVLEVKYFYYGGSPNHFASGHFLGWANYFTERWFYFYKQDIQPRGHVHQLGLIEAGIVIVGLVSGIYSFIQKRRITLLQVMTATALVVIFFTSSLSEVFYKNINALGNIQHPWRMLTAFIILPPILISLLLSKTKNILIPLAIIVIVAILRFPQLYGKNYTIYPESVYYNTSENLHGTVMNTVWTGEIRNYPFKSEKAVIFEGDGRILEKRITNSSRKYKVQADSNLKMVDYTFYFPGWKAYIDGAETAIEFQDPNYRGVITYTVPQGEHEIFLQYEDTKVRKLANIISLASIIIFIMLLLGHKKVEKLAVRYLYDSKKN